MGQEQDGCNGWGFNHSGAEEGTCNTTILQLTETDTTFCSLYSLPPYIISYIISFCMPERTKNIAKLAPFNVISKKFREACYHLNALYRFNLPFYRAEMINSYISPLLDFMVFYVAVPLETRTLATQCVSWIFAEGPTEFKEFQDKKRGNLFACVYYYMRAFAQDNKTAWKFPPDAKGLLNGRKSNSEKKYSQHGPQGPRPIPVAEQLKQYRSASNQEYHTAMKIGSRDRDGARRKSNIPLEPHCKRRRVTGRDLKRKRHLLTDEECDAASDSTSQYCN